MGLFGTDGVRGPAGVGPLSAQGALHLAAAFVDALGPGPHRVAVARDTRASGPLLAAAVAAGIACRGADVVDLGVLPTPGLSWFVAQQQDLTAGLMITASHNPWHDNGIKGFSGDGHKVDDAVQAATEAGYHRDLGDDHPEPGSISSVGREARTAYLQELIASVPTGALKGRTIVADTASGAGEGLLEELLAAHGAEVVSFAPPSDGRNINRGIGAVHPVAAAARVVEVGAWAGIVLDGDADRIMLVDEAGTVHDGDALLGLLAEQEHARRPEGLPGGLVVGTVTSNGGLEVWLRDLGLGFVRTAVGDRNIAAGMREHGAVLGGESSGHVLTPEACPTGDGLRVGVRILAGAAAAGQSLSALLGRIPRFPVANRKVHAGSKPPLESLEAFQTTLMEADAALGPAGGRRLVRYSGTEPVLRILVEGPRDDLVELWADRIAASAASSLKAGSNE
jgi:phosphoglucosamine mutase